MGAGGGRNPPPPPVPEDKKKKPGLNSIVRSADLHRCMYWSNLTPFTDL